MGRRESEGKKGRKEERKERREGRREGGIPSTSMEEVV